ncbi:MAG: PSD1 and planctomycete cytochrome C domain-containing protein [Pirellula sp.]|nr:PSD1 and planctomycete cytochrome C domain-containing protein [Pirellula sp.]
MENVLRCLLLFTGTFLTLQVSAILVAQEGAIVVSQEETKPTAEQIQFFEAKIRPVLIEHCYRCHSTESGTVRGGLGVDHREALFSGGASGPAVIPGNLEESILWNAINYVDYEMPPNRKLSPSILADFKTWIEMGAPDPRVNEGVVVHSKVTPEIIEEGKKHWSFQPPKKVHAEAGNFSDWAQTEIDRHVASTWAESGVSPAQDADPSDLIRRLFDDLIGLPPTIAERNQFLIAYEKNPEEAIAKQVDELLGRPQFGERWGRHWLDVARYAESTGQEVDMAFPQAWRYRDFVIDSFQNDKPYDLFIKQQIAGDLIKVDSDQEWAENLVATGFLAIGTKALMEQNPRQFQADVIDEQIDVTTRVILGLSVSCARCHDHKFDPIAQEDYYAMAGIFSSTETCFGGNRTQRIRQPSRLIQLPINDHSEKLTVLATSDRNKLKEELKALEELYEEARRERRTNSNQARNLINVGLLDQLIGQTRGILNSYDEQGKPYSLCMGVQDRPSPRDAKLLVRGEINQPAQEIDRGVVRVLANQPVPISESNSGRLELANWLASRDNPLTARVMVNRIWMHLLGKAIVRETDNFGVSGPKPTHPELLDYLAVEFMDNDWRVKHIVRLIATSRVYRLSSKFDSMQMDLDPENVHIARGNSRKLNAESMRDAILSVSGQIDLKRPERSPIAKMGEVPIGANGPAVLPPGTLTALIGKGNDFSALQKFSSGLRGNAQALQATSYVRSVYLPIARNSLPRSLDVFDFAEPSLVVGERETSNTPDQALYMLNNAFVLEQSDALARKILKQASNRRGQATAAFHQILGREPTESERKATESFFRNADKLSADKLSAGKNKEQSNFQALSQLCQALMCSAEFRIIN